MSLFRRLRQRLIFNLPYDERFSAFIQGQDDSWEYIEFLFQRSLAAQDFVLSVAERIALLMHLDIEIR